MVINHALKIHNAPMIGSFAYLEDVQINVCWWNARTANTQYVAMKILMAHALMIQIVGMTGYAHKQRSV